MGKPWSVTLTPHRSLTRKGYIALMVIVAGFNLTGGLLFYALGAWPIAGFMGLDVLLIWLAFKWNFRHGQRAERIIVDGDAVQLLRIDAKGGEQELQFNRRWLQVELQHDAERDLVGKLYLRSHGRTHEIASFLGAEERASLAAALRAAL